MKTSFSLSSRFELGAQAGVALLALVGLTGFVYAIFQSRFAVAPIVLAGVFLAVLGATLAGLRREARLVARMGVVLESASRGVLEPRVIDIRGNGQMAQLALGLNDVLDQVEAVFRESLTVVTRMGQGNFDREPQTAGLRGLFPQVLRRIATAQSQVSETVSALRQSMDAMAQGDFSVRPHVEGAAGDYRLILDNASHAIQSLDRILGEVATAMDAMARGQLTSRVSVPARGMLDKLKTDINRSLDSLSAAMQTIGENAQQVAGAASETSTAIGQLADGAQAQSQYISQVVTAIRETVSAVGDISASTETASRQAQESASVVRDGRKKMEQMVEVVNGIATNSEKISKITDVIEKIANKTNLLSLNAAIEAARAGEHGKGFAVVADEVGKLAASSADSTKEITQLIQQAVAEANRAVVAVREVSTDMERIVTSSTQADSMLQRISAAVEEQTRTMQEINSSVMNLDKIANSNSSASEELAASMIELSKVADSTRREIERFHI
ncbi:methyl-accepting chemotaxis protein [Ramlibacter sp. MAHUQ-53]|uniref:methyl-accepting chemotaxis protein n=1 Tax=unclassified Ramlibacter TaxID=2617605 RepID=UPI00362B99E0